MRRFLLASALLVMHGVPSLAHGQAHGSSVWIGAGWTFPSGGDWSDTYGEGPHASVDFRREVAARWAIRAGLTGASFVSQAFHGHPKEAHRGRIVVASVGAAFTPPVAADHLYLLGGVGAYGVSGTWLTAHDSIDPYRTQTVLGVDMGVGVTVLAHGFVEGRHHIAFRPTRGWARFIPVTLGWRW
ncbi:MAG: hypothetical protein M3154_08690 [Candidatus Eremiobacteraeota bacterium]|nr:hypothetical protein [Candidatus Eremiobacteraeota bacterium]